MNDKLLKEYARLTVHTGVNIQKGQGCIIRISVSQQKFALELAEEAYMAGASWVRIDWELQEFTRLKFIYEQKKVLGKVRKWEIEQLKEMVKELPAMIYVISDDPDGLSGIDPDVIQKATSSKMKVRKPYRDMIEDRYQWTIIAAASTKWAKKVYPDLSQNTALEKLWNAILDAVRISKGADSVEKWREHNSSLKKKCDLLNSLKLNQLHYKNSIGTDFTCGLINGSRWNGGGDTTVSGVDYCPNMPTEEVFISPMKGAAEGTVVATRPLSYAGVLIDNFNITFEKGKVVKVEAKTGKEMLEQLISTDDGASMLGEAALIPYDSPISNSKTLFYETLFDENASCHLALGMGFGSALENFAAMSRKEQVDRGINDSSIHVDFMIGSEDLNIDGYSEAQNKTVPIFRNGNWSI
jgi:aminopeptidase